MEYLIKYIMVQLDVDYEAASECAQHIMYAVDEMMDKYFEED